jgi:hypothetical protein
VNVTGNPLNVSPEEVDALIVGESFLEVAPKQTVVAVLRLANGQCVIGEAHCLNPDKFTEELGKTNARADAVRKVWSMVSFMARDRFAKAEAAAPAIAALSNDTPRIILPN